MPRKAARRHPDQPYNFNVGDARAQVLSGRGHRAGDTSVWYWRVSRRSETGRWESVPGPGWATRQQAERYVAQMVGSGEAGAVRKARSGGWSR